MDNIEVLKGYGPKEALEIAKIIGQPLDPRKPYSDLVSAICDTDTAAPEDYVYVHDAELETDKAYIITSTGVVTPATVTLKTPTELSFFDLNTTEYNFKLTELLKKKEDALARIKKKLNREMNAYENYKVISLLAAGVQSDKLFGPSSGNYDFTFDVLVNMRESLVDYGDQFVLICGQNVHTQTMLWDFSENKFFSLEEATRRLGISIVRIGNAQSVEIDDAGTQTKVLDPDTAYLVALNSEMGKPIVWVRKQLGSIKNLAGVEAMNGDAPERIVFVGSNPKMITNAASRYYAVGVAGLSEAAAMLKNAYTVAKYSVSL